jgi:hypothetical protein
MRCRQRKPWGNAPKGHLEHGAWPDVMRRTEIRSALLSPRLIIAASPYLPGRSSPLPTGPTNWSPNRYLSHRLRLHVGCAFQGSPRLPLVKAQGILPSIPGMAGQAYGSYYVTERHFYRYRSERVLVKAISTKSSALPRSHPGSF